MPELDGIAATREVVASTGTRVLVLTTYDLDEYVFGALRAGAAGFLLKNTDAPGLLAAVRTVAAGEGLIAPAVTRRLLDRFTVGPDPMVAARLGALTRRETEVLGLVARGLSNAEVAVELHLSPATVKDHVAAVLAKLGVRDRVQATIAAYAEPRLRAVVEGRDPGGVSESAGWTGGGDFTVLPAAPAAGQWAA